MISEKKTFSRIAFNINKQMKNASDSFTIKYDPFLLIYRRFLVYIPKKATMISLYLLFITFSLGFAQPEINVLQTTTNISSGGTYSFGTAQVTSGTQAITFIIGNTGTAPLSLTGTPLVDVTGTNASDFTVTTQPSISTISLASTTSFVVTFSPSAVGTRTAVLTILNNDTDEATFTVNITGTGSNLIAPVITSKSALTDQVTLQWQDTNTSEQGYAIYRTKATNTVIPPTPGTFKLIFTTQANVTQYVDIGLKSKTIYVYKLQALSGTTDPNSSFSDTTVIRTIGKIPITPSNLNATTLSQTEIQLEWEDNSTNESGFGVLRSSTGNPGTFSLIATANSNVASYIDQDLDSKTTYYYRVRALSVDGSSALTASVSATTLSNAPASPIDLTVVPVSGSELQLDWEDESDNESGFIIARTTQQFATFENIDTVAADVTTYRDVGLTNNTTYFYFVQAYNVDGLSEKHTNVAAEKTADVPLIPTNVQLTAKDFKTITVTWDVSTAPSTERAATGYKIEVANILGIRPAGQRRSGQSTSRTAAEELIFYQIGSVDANTRTFEVSNLISNLNYTFRLRAFNNNGNSPYTSEVSTATLPNTAVSKPSAPSNLIAESVSETEIDLTWQDNSSSEKLFKIEQQVSGSNTWTEIGQVVAGVTSFSNIDLMPDQVYSYRVRASNEGGDSDYSNVDSTQSECNLIVLVSNNSGGTTICAGKSALLAVNTNVTDANYQWKRNGINIPNANLPILNATRTGEYDCQVISGSCRKSSSVPQIIIVQSGFDVSIRTTDSLTQVMEASIKGAQGYQWYRDYQPISGAVSSIYQPTGDGTFFVIATNNGCSATSNLISVTMTVTGIQETAFSKSMKLSPNPTADESLLEVSNGIYGAYKILITDLQGRVQMVLSGVKKQKNFRQILPVQNLAQGVYLVKLHIRDQEGVQKLVKE